MNTIFSRQHAPLLVAIYKGPSDTKISESGIRLIIGFEGIKLHAYDDGLGIWTIGIGTTVYPNGERVKRGDSCTEEQAREYLAHDLKKFEACVNQYARVS